MDNEPLIFVITDEEWDSLQTLLDREPQDMPRLRELMQRPCPFFNN